MLLGAALQPMSRTPETGALIARARELEGAGFDSLWVLQAIGRGFLLPDPLLSLAAAAAVTHRVQLGTAVLQLPLYQPAALAHQIFSLMHLAGDRLRIGVGAGSTESDFKVFGGDFATRFSRFNQSLAKLKAVLATGVDGDIDLAPYPNLLGGPPLLYGTWGKSVERAAHDFSGWIASGLYRSTEQVIDALKRYRQAGGKNAIVSSIALGPEHPSSEHRARLEAFADAGFDTAVVMLRPGGPTAQEVRSWIPATAT